MSQSKRSSVLMSDPVGRRLFSSVREVLAEVAEFPRQLVHHLLEDHRVHVLAWNGRVSRQYVYIEEQCLGLNVGHHERASSQILTQ